MMTMMLAARCDLGLFNPVLSSGCLSGCESKVLLYVGWLGTLVEALD
jgi:hypothetical protein